MISPVLDVFSVTLAMIKSDSLSILISIENTERNENVETLGLIDSGAGGEFIDQNYVKNSGFKTQFLDKPTIARNVDGTENKKKKITSFVDLELTINGRTNTTWLLVTGLGKQRIILGFPWLNKWNPNIDWKTGKFEWRQRPLKIKRYHDSSHPLSRAKTLTQETIKQILQKPTIVEEPDQDERLNHTLNPANHEDILLAYIEEVEQPNETWINAKTSSATEFHLKHDTKKEDIPLKQQIPEAFHEFLDVFDETKADWFPKPRSWDHKIELKEGFKPK